MELDLIHVDPVLLAKWNRPVPRYTSYPTAPQFYPIDENEVRKKLIAFDRTKKALSLYFHIPFCKSMCLFCGCSVVLNRDPVRQNRYLTHLLKEIELVSSQFNQKREVSQLHLGGGTPTSLSAEEFEKLMEKIHSSFTIAPNSEISIEIDPRTVYADQGAKLRLLKRLGFNRVSFGVQDLDPRVQEAVRRRQSEEMTISTYERARELGFEGINIDLIYGLPHQTRDSFAKTAEKMVLLKPDRIAFYSYAQIPWLKAHQKAIPEKTLPSTEEKFGIYVDARARFMKGGYTAIGMDHFALSTDPMAQAYEKRSLTRNFQGYAVAMAEDMIGFGLTAIGFIEGAYFQNVKELPEYEKRVAEGKIPVHRGYLLTDQDRIHREAIQSMMCHFELDIEKFGKLGDLAPLIEEGFIEEKEGKYIATPVGRLFIRLVASAFDQYIGKGQFSRAV